MMLISTESNRGDDTAPVSTDQPSPIADTQQTTCNILSNQLGIYRPDLASLISFRKTHHVFVDFRFRQGSTAAEE
jgi:hypothetical protein